MDHNHGKPFPSEKMDFNYQNSQPYDPSRYATTPQEPAPEGTLVLVDESGQQVGALGEHINVAGIVPGSSEPVEIDLSRTDGVVTYNVRPTREYRDRPQLRRSYTIPDDHYLRPIPDNKQNTFGRTSRCSVYSSSPYDRPHSVYDRPHSVYDRSHSVYDRPHSVYECPQKVRPIDSDYLRDSRDPAYANSRLVGTAATASRVIVSGAGLVAKAMEAGAKTFTEKTKPVNTPMTFQPTTHNYVRQIHNYSASGAKIASKTVGTVTHHAQNLGARLAGKGEGHDRERSKPGLLNKGLMAFGTIADGIDYASKLILTSTSHATTTMVGHRYGSEAEELARGLTGVVKNVGLVYVDASGVSRRAIVKSVAKGMVVGRVKGGGEVIFEGNNTSQAFMTQPGVSASGSGSPLPPYSGAPPSPGQYQNYSTPPHYGSGRTSPLPPHIQGQFAPPPPNAMQYNNPAPPGGAFKY